VALAGLFAISYERRLARQEAAQERTLAELKAARAGLFQTIASYVDTRIDPIAQQLDVLARDARASKTREHELAIIRYHVERLRRFAADIRDVIAIDDRALRLQMAPVDLREVVHTTVASNEPLARQYGITLRVNAETSLPVHGDSARLTQVLNDGLRNAFNFTPSGGTVHVIAGVQEARARVTIQDSGRGLAASERSSLFQPFTTAHAPGESREQGTGLGLFVGKGIIEAHQGTVWLESEGRGKGARLVVEIPLNSRPFDIRNAPPLPAGGPQLPPGLAQAGLPDRR
jgi:signal transduction histidine kinase